MGHVLAGELEDALSTEGMFKRFLADSALGADKSPVPSRPATFKVEYASHASASCARRRTGRWPSRR